MTYEELCLEAIGKRWIGNNHDGIKVAKYAVDLINKLQIDITEIPVTGQERVRTWTLAILPKLGDQEFTPRHVVEILESELNPDDLDGISLTLIMKQVRATLLERVSLGMLTMTQKGKQGRPFKFKHKEVL